MEGLSYFGCVEIINGNLVDFIFDGINFLDSISNELVFYGFIIYKIKFCSDVVVGDIFINVVDIYFDFNFVIVINMVNIEIVLLVSVDGLVV